ncbi:MAG: signal recognition particle-docking protein FtsY [Candidatus Nanopelagicaceae bacterium]
MALFSKLFAKIRGGATSASDWDEIQESLIGADLGAQSASEIIEIAKKAKSDEISEAIFGALSSWLSKNDRKIAAFQDRPTTVMIVGVNGTGKTTSSAKLVSYLKRQNKSVLLAAADTFRAAAVEQLQTWAQRLNVEVVTGRVNGDPASVAFEAATKAKNEAIDYLIIDTAGRLHTKSGLMDELGKVRRVVEKVLPIDEVLLVVDATTGQNGIVQAKVFMESVAITGLILTKMDGSAKGGIALAIERETGIPVKFIGVGESADDLQIFEAEPYLSGLFA